MIPEYNYAERMGEPVRTCDCGVSITREFYADNGNQPDRWRTHDAATGFLHQCWPSPRMSSTFPPPNERWWAAMCAVEDEQNESPAPSHTVPHRASRPSQQTEPQAKDDTASDFLQQYRGEL